ncbi:molybdate ABC transporter substrate-binding protein [Methanobacterium spitsbergense]|uniref:Molybdate ABC transporter substrate-binding protein n=1 Tax=Methanobacterium spitsbergense TaxID=2874285 RepID=A0A8T5UMQ6_9EURY|nr:molybdate ABC transporter substrate-binding protein [Methanobacterium spitsbergense]MBZ2165192.1 molybdate ABC transporter substrate-binding protein [Methanobacterium spitsbergense]
MNTKQLAIIGIVTIVIIIAGVYVSGILTNSGSNGQNQTITVLAGAGFVKVTNDLKIEFEKTHPGVTVNVKNGGSGELFGILETQKSADIFLPADYKYMQDAINNGYVQNNTVKNITQNIPVIGVQMGNPKNITSLYDLAKPGVKVAIGDPKGPAIGKTTADILNNTNLNKTVQANVVVKTTTVNQLLTYLVTGQADAVIIWQDLATWPEGQGKIDVIQIPANESKVSTVPIAETVYTQNNNLAKEFEDFATGPQGMIIWEKWGFKPISG